MGKLVASRSKYTDDQRRQAVGVSGLMTKVSESTGIPETTLATWKNKTDWWDDLVVAVRSEINEVILAQTSSRVLVHAVDKAAISKRKYLYMKQSYYLVLLSE